VNGREMMGVGERNHGKEGVGENGIRGWEGRGNGKDGTSGGKDHEGKGTNEQEVEWKGNPSSVPPQPTPPPPKGKGRREKEAVMGRASSAPIRGLATNKTSWHRVVDSDRSGTIDSLIVQQESFILTQSLLFDYSQPGVSI